MTQFDHGRYRCCVTGQGFNRSKERKTPFFWLSFRPLGKIDHADPGSPLIACPDAEREVHLFLTEKSIEFTRQRLSELGWKGTQLQELEPGAQFSFIGREVELECRHELTDGSVTAYERWEVPSNSVRSVHAAGIAREVDALSRGTAPVAQWKPRQVPTEIPNDEVPF